MAFSFAPILQNDTILATALTASDFDALYAAASDPAIWEQHPNPLRYQQAHFTHYFEGALQSGTAYLIRAAATNAIIGCSRFYDYQAAANSVHIGYTFFVTACWGKGYNRQMKQLMLAHAFEQVNTVYFTVGAVNKRSQIAVERLGAQKLKEAVTAYYGEAPKLDFIYALTKTQWLNRQPYNSI